MTKPYYKPPTPIDQAEIIPLSKLAIAKVNADEAKKKLYFLSSVLFYTQENTQLYDDEGIYVLSQLIGDAAQDIDAVLYNLEKMEVSNGH